MTGRAEFGDFLYAARQHLDTLAGSPGRAAGARDVVGVSESLGRLVAVMGRHVEDVTGTHRDLPVSKQPALTPWARAGMEAREALASAARFLPHRTGDRWPAPPAASEFGGGWARQPFR